MMAKCYCGSDQYRPSIDCSSGRGRFKEKFSVLRCTSCGLARTWPVPLAGDRKNNFYDSQESWQTRQESIKLWQGFARLLLKILKKFKVKGEILDVGCNLGNFVSALRSNSYQVIGIDLDQSAIDQGRKIFSLNNELQVGSLDACNFSNRFSALIYWHVLEYIADLAGELDLAAKALVKEGLLIVAVPNYNSVWRRLLRCRWYGYLPVEHIWQFDRASLANIIANNGFQVEKVYRRLSLHHDTSFGLKGSLKIIIYSLAYLFASGDNLIIVARKK